MHSHITEERFGPAQINLPVLWIEELVSKSRRLVCPRRHELRPIFGPNGEQLSRARAHLELVEDVFDAFGHVSSPEKRMFGARIELLGVDLDLDEGRMRLASGKRAAPLVPIPEGTTARSGSVSHTALGRETAAGAPPCSSVRTTPPMALQVWALIGCAGIAAARVTASRLKTGGCSTT